MIKDGVIRKMTGVLDNGQLLYPTEGTPQGGDLNTDQQHLSALCAE
jgi:RNA-directed DNA polymerase